MVDFAIEVYKNLNPGSEPSKFVEKRAKVLAELKELQKTSEHVVNLILLDEVQAQVQPSSRDSRQLFEILQKDHGVSTFAVYEALFYTSVTVDT